MKRNHLQIPARNTLSALSELFKFLCIVFFFSSCGASSEDAPENTVFTDDRIPSNWDGSSDWPGSERAISDITQ